jgi:hypothetical protein
MVFLLYHFTRLPGAYPVHNWVAWVVCRSHHRHLRDRVPGPHPRVPSLSLVRFVVTFVGRLRQEYCYY